LGIESKQQQHKKLIMKRIILSATIVFGIALGINNNASAKANKKEEVTTVLNNVKNIQEIEVHGNVQLYLTSGNTESVKVYDDYYTQNALVQEQNNVLRITSYNDKPLVVWVTVDDLTKISAFDKVQVKSFGKLSALDLSVVLNNDAVAQLDINAINTSITLKDHSSANLTGNIENGSLLYDRFTNFNTQKLSSNTLTETLNPRPEKHFHRLNPNLIEG
jgi:hypothetical protein